MANPDSEQTAKKSSRRIFWLDILSVAAGVSAGLTVYLCFPTSDSATRLSVGLLVSVSVIGILYLLVTFYCVSLEFRHLLYRDPIYRKQFWDMRVTAITLTLLSPIIAARLMDVDLAAYLPLIGNVKLQFSQNAYSGDAILVFAIVVIHFSYVFLRNLKFANSKVAAQEVAQNELSGTPVEEGLPNVAESKEPSRLSMQTMWLLLPMVGLVVLFMTASQDLLMELPSEIYVELPEQFRRPFVENAILSNGQIDGNLSVENVKTVFFEAYVKNSSKSPQSFLPTEAVQTSLQDAPRPESTPSGDSSGGSTSDPKSKESDPANCLCFLKVQVISLKQKSKECIIRARSVASGQDADGPIAIVFAYDSSRGPTDDSITVGDPLISKDRFRIEAIQGEEFDCIVVAAIYRGPMLSGKRSSSDTFDTDWIMVEVSDYANHGSPAYEFRACSEARSVEIKKSYRYFLGRGGLRFESATKVPFRQEENTQSLKFAQVCKSLSELFEKEIRVKRSSGGDSLCGGPDNEWLEGGVKAFLRLPAALKDKEKRSGFDSMDPERYDRAYIIKAPGLPECGPANGPIDVR